MRDNCEDKKKMDWSLFSTRLREARDASGLNQEQLASRMAVSLSTIQNYENGRTRPRQMKVVKELANAVGCKVEWLIGAEDVVNDFKQNVRQLIEPLRGAVTPLKEALRLNRDEESGQSQTLERIESIERQIVDFDDEYVKVPLVAAELAAGGGSLIDSKEVIKDLAFRRDWLKTRGKLKDMVCMTVQGDSMEPTLRNKDVALINLANTTPSMGGIYAVAHDGGLYIKRLILEPGRIILRSDNRYYNDIILDKADRATMDLVKIVGRAVWWCHDERVY